ncbi:hypothetical protein EIP91_001934 [Steccherinum ochraceum]|uniref:Uncharacterized protein n=1 Tax=Steccherinum ochraceum TaxID=92696 RepID=A0A4V2MWE9_9APHY|nr:hypothetical protein EIP91_001934 [Steccherinum ochraceum]
MPKVATSRSSKRPPTVPSSSTAASSSSTSSSSRKSQPPITSTHETGLRFDPLKNKYVDSDDEEDSSPAAVKEREKERLDAINDIDFLYPQLKDLPEDQVRDFKEFMLAPADLSPLPTEEDIRASPGKTCFYGFYMSEADIRKFAIKYDKNRRPTTFTSFEDMCFITSFLSNLMNHKMVWLYDVIVGEEHKRRIRTMVEEVGEIAFCLALCSNWEHRRGFKPTNREVKIIGRALKKMPHWWRGAEGDY